MITSDYSQNSTRNCPLVEINGVQFFYSYSTCVAVRYSEGLFVSENRWGGTTGKHLNWIDGGSKKDRLGKQDFLRHVYAAAEEAGTPVPQTEAAYRKPVRTMTTPKKEAESSLDQIEDNINQMLRNLGIPPLS